jgi:hypothetical protein
MDIGPYLVEAHLREGRSDLALSLHRAFICCLSSLDLPSHCRR